MEEKNKNELNACAFNKENRKEILKQLVNKEESSKNIKDYKTLIDEVRNSYTNVEIDYLLQNYEIKNKHYTDESIKNFVTLFIAIGAFAISVFKETHGILNTKNIFIITLVGAIIVISLRAFSPKGSELNTAIFLLKQAKKFEESSKEVNKAS